MLPPHRSLQRKHSPPYKNTAPRQNRQGAVGISPRGRIQIRKVRQTVAARPEHIRHTGQGQRDVAFRLRHLPHRTAQLGDIGAEVVYRLPEMDGGRPQPVCPPRISTPCPAEEITHGIAEYTVQQLVLWKERCQINYVLCDAKHQLFRHFELPPIVNNKIRSCYYGKEAAFSLTTATKQVSVCRNYTGHILSCTATNQGTDTMPIIDFDVRRAVADQQIRPCRHNIITLV